VSFKNQAAEPKQTSKSITTSGQWMALTAALLGWLFDGAEMGVFSMVGRRAIADLLGYSKPILATASESAGSISTVIHYTKPTLDQENEIAMAFGVIIAVFLVGAAAGGVLFGWLGDRIGRVRAMSLSVLVYAVFTGFCGFAQDPVQLGVLRFIASLGMGGEWALGVALVMEVWPNRSRALMAGLIGAAGNAGYLLVGIISMGLNSVVATVERALSGIGLSSELVASLVSNDGWRIMMMLGTLPALLTFFFRMFVPESHKWEEGKSSGHTAGWRTEDLLGVVLGCLGPALIIYVWTGKNHPMWERVVGTPLGLVIATVGFSYPVVRYLQRQMSSEGAGSMSTNMSVVLGRMFLGACLSGVALLGTWGTTQWAMTWAGKLASKVKDDAPNLLERFPTQWTQIAVAIGAITGTLLAAWLGEKLGRRLAYTLQCVFSILSVLWFYQMHSEYGLPFLFAAFVAGICTASFYGWLPLYLPELFPTRVRATCQGFGFNFGRILAAIGALQMSALLAQLSGFTTYAGETGSYPVACSFLTAIYLVGIVLIFFAPETRGKPLPE
jgi:MFS transporter, SHS family, sialic acid transporter